MTRFEFNRLIFFAIVLFGVIMAIGSLGTWFMLNAGTKMPWLSIPINGTNDSVDRWGWWVLAVAIGIMITALGWARGVKRILILTTFLTWLAFWMVMEQRAQLIEATEGTVYTVGLDWGASLIITAVIGLSIVNIVGLIGELR